MTAVSKASPAIKKIISAIESSSGQKWSGRKISRQLEHEIAEFVRERERR